MGIKNWIITRSLKKGLKKIIQGVLAYVSAQKLSEYGVTIDEGQLIVGLFALLEVARNYFKTKYNVKFL